jgi:hypothetical protein
MEGKRSDAAKSNDSPGLVVTSSSFVYQNQGSFNPSSYPFFKKQHLEEPPILTGVRRSQDSLETGLLLLQLSKQVQQQRDSSPHYYQHYIIPA